VARGVLPDVIAMLVRRRREVKKLLAVRAPSGQL
jgi:hypothetical protein